MPRIKREILRSVMRKAKQLRGMGMSPSKALKESWRLHKNASRPAIHTRRK